jgi:phosphoribosylformylglycinamidine synthase PurS subunit
MPSREERASGTTSASTGDLNPSGKLRARVYVMPKAGVLDPQGKAIGHALEGLGFAGIGEVRAGKVIELELSETDPAKAKAAAEEMARRLLANTVIESFRVEVA